MPGGREGREKVGEEEVKKRTRKESGSEERKERNGIIQHLWMRQTYTDSYPQHPHLHTLTLTSEHSSYEQCHDQWVYVVPSSPVESSSDHG